MTGREFVGFWKLGIEVLRNILVRLRSESKNHHRYDTRENESHGNALRMSKSRLQ